MATIIISNSRDRLVTILIAPMMTCSARLPVYALLISAFIPNQKLWAGIDLQGLVLFLLYLSGILGAMTVAWILKRFTSEQFRMNALMMELPSYHMPRLGNLAISLWQRAEIFLRRVGGIILIMTLALWVLSSFPLPPEGATGTPIQYSVAGILVGQTLARKRRRFCDWSSLYHWARRLPSKPDTTPQPQQMAGPHRIFAIADRLQLVGHRSQRGAPRLHQPQKLRLRVGALHP